MRNEITGEKKEANIDAAFAEVEQRVASIVSRNAELRQRVEELERELAKARQESRELENFHGKRLHIREKIERILHALEAVEEKK